MRYIYQLKKNLKQTDKKGKIGFQEALNGIVFSVEGGNFRIMLLIGTLAVIVSAIVQIELIEWCLIILCITIVLTAEAVNTAIELICDHVNTNYDNRIGKIKDIAAGAVLISSIGAAAIGTMILGPYILSLL